MKFIKFTCDFGYNNYGEIEYEIYPDSINNKDLDDLSKEIAYAQASMYEYLAIDEIYEEDYDTEAEYKEAIEAHLDEYYERLDYIYEELSPKEWLNETDWTYDVIVDRIFKILQKEYSS